MVCFSLYSATGDLDNIRKAYNSFSLVYPLTPELWQKYIDVELVVAQTPKEIEEVKELFKKALQDYYCKLDIKNKYKNVCKQILKNIELKNILET